MSQSNLIKDATPKSADKRKKHTHFRHIIGIKKLRRKKSSRRIPILYAAENGLCFQTYDKSLNDGSQATEITKDAENTTIVVTSRNCDVQGSVADFVTTVKVEENTSDYDSQGELDSFSNSIPISLKSVTQPNMSSAPTKPRSRQNSESRNSTSETVVTFVSNFNEERTNTDSEHVSNNDLHGTKINNEQL